MRNRVSPRIAVIPCRDNVVSKRNITTGHLLSRCRELEVLCHTGRRQKDPLTIFIKSGISIRILFIVCIDQNFHAYGIALLLRLDLNVIEISIFQIFIVIRQHPAVQIIVWEDIGRANRISNSLCIFIFDTVYERKNNEFSALKVFTGQAFHACILLFL